MKLSIALSAAALLCTAALTAQASEEGRLSYKGAALGESQSAFLSKLPDYKCTGHICLYDSGQCGGSLSGIGREATDAYVKRLDECKARASFGGALVTSGVARFRGEQLTAVTLSIPKAYMPDLEKAVAERHGQPAETDETPFRTRAGATFPNWQKTWKVGQDLLILTYMSGRLDIGSARLVSSEEAAADSAERTKRAQQGSKDF